MLSKVRSDNEAGEKVLVIGKLIGYWVGFELVKNGRKHFD
jgi:hypothetical protein